MTAARYDAAMDEADIEAARELLDACRQRALRLATAESLTGGLIAATLTEVPGASDVVDRAWVTYTCAAKTELLGVDAALIARGGAVQEAVARAMVAGALARSSVDIAVAVTGVAGPGPAEGRPAGRVHIAAAMRGDGEALHAQMDYGPAGRSAVRRATVRDALALLRRRLG